MSDGHPNKWCPHCHGYPAYKVSKMAMMSLKIELWNELRLRFRHVHDGLKDDYFLKCLHCDGTGSFNIWSVQPREYNTDTGKFPDHDDQKEIYDLLMKIGAQLIRYRVTGSTENWVYIEAPDGTGGS